MSCFVAIPVRSTLKKGNRGGRISVSWGKGDGRGLRREEGEKTMVEV